MGQMSQEVSPVSEKNQSQKIRDLYQGGSSLSTISKQLGIRYQTVWRTLHRPFKGVTPITTTTVIDDPVI